VDYGLHFHLSRAGDVVRQLHTVVQHIVDDLKRQRQPASILDGLQTDRNRARALLITDRIKLVGLASAFLRLVWGLQLARKSCISDYDVIVL